ncbi:hypothetical protein OG897_27255 [Streptomyces sp. NBC_00237]|uniref:DUF6817 domain-containing protein n=1 Tax=Streptomyces sp. NBC_00237 TaxID=2975687 RepID=UPI0022520935|nr:hypothetical protein [Streptomyces sp. NBC_00237]MCX5205141.1 hypothetical protein [Streptomyces sp. NBC_00237]
MRHDAERAVCRLLHEQGAATLPHPGGTLLAHLDRVRGQLAEWGARPALRIAGLCHAAYGTDGFAAALLPLDQRVRLRDAAGSEAEAVVYFYASCDRQAVYPVFADPGMRFTDRFTGLSRVPALQEKRDFAELTAANELDIARVDAAFRERHGPQLLVLFHRFGELLSPGARRGCAEVLGRADLGTDGKRRPEGA